MATADQRDVVRRARDTTAELHAMLGERGVATTAQLARQGLLATADALALPRVTLDLTLRGAGSTRPATCVSFAADAVDLTRVSARTIGHDIATTELLRRRAAADAEIWLPAPRIGGGRDTIADLLLVSPTPGSLGVRAAAELDLGYPRERLSAKLAGGGQSMPAGPWGYVLGTTLLKRLPWFIERAAQIAADRPELAWIEAWWLDLESPTDRYRRYDQSGRPTVLRWDRDR